MYKMKRIFIVLLLLNSPYFYIGAAEAGEIRTFCEIDFGDFTTPPPDPCFSFIQCASPQVAVRLSTSNNQGCVKPPSHYLYMKDFEEDENEPVENLNDSNLESCPSTSTNNPIDTTNGSKYRKEIDFKPSGLSPLKFIRYYSSNKNYSFDIGMNWQHSYSASLTAVRQYRSTFYGGNGNPDYSSGYTNAHDACVQGWPSIRGRYNGIYAYLSNSVASYINGSCLIRDPGGNMLGRIGANSILDYKVHVNRPNGNLITFSYVNGKLRAPSNDDIQLIETSIGYTLTTTEDTVEEYDLSGRLKSITDRKGIQQLLTYKGLAQVIESVTDSFGNSLGFDYSGAILTTVTLPDGTKLNFGYDAKYNFSTITREDTTVKTYVYENAQSPNALTGIVDENNQRYMTFGYDAQGRATTSELAGGAEKVTVDFIDGLTSTVTDALGQLRTYRFTKINGEKRLSDIEGAACGTCGSNSNKTTYDANGYVNSSTNFNGQVTTMINNDRGLPLSRIEAVGTEDERTTVNEWHPTYALPTCIIEDAKTTSYTYSANGLLESRIAYDTSKKSFFSNLAKKRCSWIESLLSWYYDGIKKRITTYTYYPDYGLVKSIDGPRTDINDISEFTYDASGNLASITNALGHVTQLNNYTVRGKPQEIIDPNGLVTTITYDVRGRIDVVTVGGLATDYDFDAVGNLDLVTRADGSFIDYEYDAAHRLTDVRDQTGSHIHYTLDLLGNRKGTDIQDASGNLKRTSTSLYNQLGQLEKTVGAALQTTDYLSYDGNGNLEHIRDADGKNTLLGYDALNRLETTTNELNDVSTTVYDPQDNIISVTDFKGLVTTYNYDGLGNRTQRNSPDTRLTRYTSHDGNGNVLKMISAQNQTSTYTYDALNRVDFIRYSDGSTVDYVYDVGANAKGRLSSITYANSLNTKTGITAWSYDIYGRISSKNETVNGITLTTAYNYNPTTGQLDNIITAGGHTLTYDYLDAQVSAISLDGKKIMSGISYEPFALANEWTWGNGATSSKTYDLDGRIDSYTLGDSTNEIVYTSAGNIQSITDLVDVTNNQTFNYDDLHRINNYFGSTDGESYDYDAGSNRIGLTDSTTGLSDTYVIDPVSNKLTSITGTTNRSYTYNLNGSITSDSNHTYGYDARNRLVSVDTNLAMYQINGLGQRVQKKAAGKTTLYHFNQGGQLVAEADNTGLVSKEYYYFNGQPIAVSEDASPSVSQYTLVTENELGNSATWQLNTTLKTLTIDAPSDNLVGTYTVAIDDWWEEVDIGQAKRQLALRVSSIDGRLVVGLLSIEGTSLAGRFMVYSEPTTAQYVANFEYTGIANTTLDGLETITSTPSTLLWDATQSSLSLTEYSGLMTGDYLVSANNVFNVSTTQGDTTLLFYTDIQERLVSVLLLENNGLVEANLYAQIGDVQLSGYSGSVTNKAEAKVNYIHTDHLGTPRVITDENNTTIWSWHSDPFGKAKPNEDVDGDGSLYTFNLRFAGQYYDVETNLHYNYFRDYDPSTGRYVQSDPIGLAGGLNTYGYVGGNPLGYSDPYGLSSKITRLIIPAPWPTTTADGTDISYTWGIPGFESLDPYNKVIQCVAFGMCNDSAEDAADQSDGDSSTDGESCPSNDRDNWEKIPRSRPPAYRPKNEKEPVFQGDRAGDRSHGGSKWKKWDKARDWKQGNPRSGTYDVNGRRLRD